MVEFGLCAEQIAALCEAIEDGQRTVPSALENRRAYDREYRRQKRESGGNRVDAEKHESGGKSGGNPPDTGSSRVRDNLSLLDSLESPNPNLTDLHRKEKTTDKKKSRGGLNGHQADFDRWYAAYPKHVDRGHAEPAFLKALTQTDLATLIAGAEAYSRQVASWPREKIAHPATWLNGYRWDDEPDRAMAPSRARHEPLQLPGDPEERLANLRRILDE
jgi:hypothetical protein